MNTASDTLLLELKVLEFIVVSDEYILDGLHLLVLVVAYFPQYVIYHI